MRVLATGATGFVGRALTTHLLGRDHDVIAAVRNPTRARGQLGDGPTTIDLYSDAQLAEAIDQADAIVNLAGEGIFERRWNNKRKRALRQSRLSVTQRLVEALSRSKARPRVLVSASAIGYYGDQGDRTVSETDPCGPDFLAKLCEDWEAAAQPAAQLGVRLVTLRIGVVLGQGGALQQMIPAFALGLGGRLGSGKQWSSWIHLDDLVTMIERAITDETWRGVYNATAPNPVTNRRMTQILAAQLKRRALLPVPGLALRMALGERASVVLGGQRVLPARAQEEHFHWKFGELRHALADILGTKGVQLEREGDGFRLMQKVTLPRHRDEVFQFFSSPRNLGLLTPPWMKFEFLDDEPVSPNDGVEYNYRVRLGPVPMRWRSEITSWRPNAGFVDVQRRGPYARWHHEHSFVDDGDGITMTDTVRYRMPFGLLGRIAHPLVVAPLLRAIFSYRATVIARRFAQSQRQLTGAA